MNICLDIFLESSRLASQESPAFYGTRSFITVITRAHHYWSLSWAIWKQSTS